jgi:hypothetical protein
MMPAASVTPAGRRGQRSASAKTRALFDDNRLRRDFSRQHRSCADKIPA